MPPPQLILASASPRRQELLHEAGYTFVTSPADIDENDHPPGLDPPELAQFLAHAKAAVVARRYPRDVVLAADTVVALEHQVLGKPADAADARRMLQSLSGTTHSVITGLALAGLNQSLDHREVIASTVQMRRLTPQEIERYIASGLWEGKAGAYGIQDQDPFVIRVSGSHTNIVGLPMERVRALLAEVGIT